MNANLCQAGRARFTLVEMLVVIAIIGILASLLMPALSKALGVARQTACLNQEKQIATGFLLYCNDNNQQFPAINQGADYFHSINYKWYNNLLSDGGYVPIKDSEWSNKAQGVLKKGIWRCPALSDAQATSGGGIALCEQHGLMSYATAKKLTQLKRPSHLWLIGDQENMSGGTHMFVMCSACSNWLPSGIAASQRHNGGSNIAFADGHVEWRDFMTLNYSYQTGDNVFAHNGKF